MRTSLLPINIFTLIFLLLASYGFSQSTELYFEQRMPSTTACNQIVVDIKVRNFNDVAIVNHNITWDSTKLRGINSELNSATSGFASNSTLINNNTSFGYLFNVFTAPNSSPLSLNDDEILYTLTLEAIGTLDATTVLRLNEDERNSFGTGDGAATLIFPPSAPIVCGGDTGGTDTTPPVITCPSNITRTVASGNTGATVSWNLPTATDNSGIPPQIRSLNFNSGDFFTVNTTSEVTYVAEDTAGNADTCTFTVTVQEETLSTGISFTAEQRPADCGATSVIVDIKVSNFNDIAGFSHMLIYDSSVLSLDQAGITINPDITGLTVNPTEPNVIVQWLSNGPSNNLNLANGTVVYSLEFTVSGSPTSNTVVRQAESNELPFGTSNDVLDANLAQLEYVFNPTTISFDSSADVTPPVVTNCPGDTTILIPLGATGTNYSWMPPLATDDCGIASVSSTVQPGDFFAVGTTTVQYTVVDEANNANTDCSFTVTVQEETISTDEITFFVEQRPTACGASTVTVDVKVLNFEDISSFSHVLVYDNQALSLATNGITSEVDQMVINPLDSTIIVSWVAPGTQDLTLADNSIIYSLEFDITGALSSSTTIGQLDDSDQMNFPFGASNVVVKGVQSVDYDFLPTNISLDASTDTEDPVFVTCPSDITVALDAGSTSIVVDWEEPLATDNCGIEDVNSNFSPGSAFELGSYEIEYTATDKSGRTATCTFNVFVEPPTNFDGVTFVADQRPADCGASTVTVDVKVENFENVSSFSHVVIYDTEALSLSMNDVQSNTTDLVGLVVNVVDSRVIVQWISGANDLSLPDGTTIYTLSFSVIGDIGSSTVVRQMNSNLPLGTSNVVTVNGLNPVDYLFTQASILFDSTNDTTPPTIEGCPASPIVERAEAGAVNAVVNWVEPEAKDLCGIVSFTSNFSPGDVFPIGTTEVKYIAEDVAGNIDSCMFDVVVEENVFSGITFIPRQESLTCSTDSVLVEVTVDNFNDVTSFSHVIEFDANVLSIDPNSVELSTSLTGLVVNPLNDLIVVQWLSGATSVSLPSETVIYSVKFEVIGNANNSNLMQLDEGAGNYPVGSSNLVTVSGLTEATYAFLPLTLQPNDTEAPTLANCPQDIVVQIPQAESNAMVNWMFPEVMDNCGVVDTMASHQPGDMFPVGTTAVEYTFRDASGNMVACTFNVEVEQQAAMTDLIVRARQVQPSTPNAFCNGRAVRVVIEVENFDTIARLNQVLTWDDSQISLVQFNVTADTLNRPNAPVFTFDTSNEITFAWNNPNGLSLPDGTVLFELDFQVNNGVDLSNMGALIDIREPIGTAVRTPTGEQSVTPTWESTTLTTNDTTPPTFTSLPMDQTVPTFSDQCAGTATWELPTVDDNCSNENQITLTASHNPDDTFPVGNTVVRYTAMDASGNEVMDSFIVTVIDNLLPVVSCQGNILASIAAPADTAVVVNDIAPTVMDNCEPIQQITYQLTGATEGNGNTDASGTAFNIGMTQVQYFAEDASGNVGTCTFTVSVADSLIGFNCPVDTIVAADENCGAMLSQLAVEITDNSTLLDSSMVSLMGATDTTMMMAGLIDLSTLRFNLGATNVLFKLIDVNGFAQDCSFTITVEDRTAPMLDCPMDRVTRQLMGEDTTMNVMGIGVVPMDNCDDAPTLTYRLEGATMGTGTGDANGLTFNQGETTVVYVTEDASGNTDSCSFVVEIMMSNIEFTCPMDTTFVPAHPSDCSRPVTGLRLNVTSGQDILDSSRYILSGATVADSITAGLINVSGTVFNLGVTNVTYELIDLSGNRSQCDFVVVVQDSIPPTLACPQGRLTFELPADGSQSMIVDGIAAVVSDNCDPDVALTFVQNGATSLSGFNDADGRSFNLGLTTVTYIAVDAAGNVSECMFEVEVVEPAVMITCPDDVMIAAMADTCGAVVNDIALTVNNPDEILLIGYRLEMDSMVLIDTSAAMIDVSGTFFELGTTEVTYFISDLQGNVQECSFLVMVSDSTAPTFDCPTDIMMSVTNPDATANLDVSLTNLFDACDGQPTITYRIEGAIDSMEMGNLNSFDFPVDTSTVTYFVEDASGNVDSCSFDVIVDVDPLMLVCPSDTMIMVTTNDSCTIVVDSIAFQIANPEIIDSSSYQLTGVTVGDSTLVGGMIDASGVMFNFGLTTVTYTVTDTSGMSQSCSFTVEVIDAAPPVFVCPDSVTQFVLAGDTATVVNDIGLQAIMDCDKDILVDYTLDGATTGMGMNDASGELFNLGTTTVTYRVADGVGNVDSCSFEVLVRAATFDFVCPTDTIVATTDSTCARMVNDLSVVIDSSIIASITYTLEGATMGQDSGDVSGVIFNRDTTTVTYFLTSTQGESASCSFDVIVQDQTAPVLNCIDGREFVNIPLGDTAAMVDVQIFPFDNCDTDLTIEYVVGPIANPIREGMGDASGMFGLGVTAVRYQVTDQSGNTANCRFDVDVSDELVMLNCLSDTVVQKDLTLCGQEVNGLLPVVEPQSAITSISYMLSGATEFISPLNGINDASGTIFNPGITEVAYTVITNRADTLRCMFNVVVLDMVPLEFMNCPTDTTVNAEVGQCYAVVDWELPTLSDTCGLMLTASHNPMDTFQIGETIVTYVAVNSEGERDSCSFTITIRDQETPSLMNCPDDAILFAGEDNCGAFYSWTLPDTMDNCMIDTLMSNFSPGDFFLVDTNVVTYMLVDMAGNTASCSFNVIVLDTIPPTLTNCPNDTTISTRARTCGNIVTWDPPMASDVCGAVELTSDVEPGTAFPVGTTTVTYTATDASGNETSCSFNITIVDDTPPEIEQLTDIVITDSLAACEVVVEWDEPMVDDNCGLASIVSSVESGSLFSAGMTTVTYFAEDNSGNRDTMSFNVILDLGGVAIQNCPTDTVIIADAGTCEQVVNWVEPTFNLQCSADSMLFQTASPGDTFPVGTTLVEYFVLNAQGDTLGCSFNVTVLDEELPVFSNCPRDTTISIPMDACEATYSWMEPVATDNCSIMELVSTHQPGDTFPIGETLVKYTATDGSGQTAVCEFTVRVIDVTPPGFVNCPDTVMVRLDGEVIEDPSSILSAAPTAVNCETIEVAFAPPVAMDGCLEVAVNQVSGPDNNLLGLGTSTFTYVAQDTSGNQDTCHVVFIVMPLEEIPVTVDNAQPCQGESFTLTAENIGVPGAVYRWSGLGITAEGREVEINSDSLTSDGIISVSVVQADGCVRTGAAIIDVQSQPEPMIVQNSAICAGDVGLTLSGMDTTDANIQSWIWILPNGERDTTQNLTIDTVSMATAGIYRLIATSDRGCEGRVLDTISVTSPPDTIILNAIADKDNSGCVGDIYKLISFDDDLISNAMENFNWRISPDTGAIFMASDTNIVDLVLEASGTYTIDHWIDINGCISDTTTISFTVGEKRDFDLSFAGAGACGTESDTLRLFENSGTADNWLWLDPQGDTLSILQNPIVPVNGESISGIYTLFSMDGMCITKDTIEVEASGLLLQPSIELPDPVCANTVVNIGLKEEYDSTVVFNWTMSKLSVMTVFDTTFIDSVNFTIDTMITEEVMTDTIVTQAGLLDLEITSMDSIMLTVEAVDGGCRSLQDTVMLFPKETPRLDLSEIVLEHSCINQDSVIVLSDVAGVGSKYTWTGPDEFEAGDATATITVNFDNVDAKNGTYFVSAFGPEGCEARDSVTLSLSPGLAQPVIDGTDLLCDGEDFDLMAIPTTDDSLSYTWTLPTGDTRTGNTVSFVANTALAGAYTVVATDSVCTSEPSDSFIVTIVSNPVLLNDNFEVLVNEIDTLNVFSNDSLLLDVSGTYEVTQRPFRGVIPSGNGFTEDNLIIYDPNTDDVGSDNLTYRVCYTGCLDPQVELCTTAFADITIKFPDDVCQIATVLTPNDDGRNDNLIISCATEGVYPNNELIIFNQWGDEVFRANPYNNDWGGTYEGKPLPDGTYFYFFTPTQGGDTQKGFITIYR